MTRLLGVVRADQLQVDDQLAATPDGGPTIAPIDVTDVFNTGHGHVQIGTAQLGSGRLNSEDLICVLRELRL